MGRGWTVGSEGSSSDGFSYDYRGQPSTRSDIVGPKSGVASVSKGDTPKTAVAGVSKSGGQGASPSQSVGPGAANVVTGKGPATKGPGSPSVVGGKVTGTGPGNLGAKTGAVNTKGPGSAAVISGNWSPPDVGDALKVLIPGNLYLFPDMKYPNVDDFWEPRYGEPGEFVGGIVNFGVDAANTFLTYQQGWHPNSPAAILSDKFSAMSSTAEGQGAVVSDWIFGDAIARAYESGPKPSTYAGKGGAIITNALDQMGAAIQRQFGGR